MVLLIELEADSEVALEAEAEGELETDAEIGNDSDTAFQTKYDDIAAEETVEAVTEMAVAGGRLAVTAGAHYFEPLELRLGQLCLE